MRQKDIDTTFISALRRQGRYGREAAIVANDATELFAAPVACDGTTEYDNRIEDEIEVEPDEEIGPDGIDSYKNSAEIERKFARYECNYRARRIRELTLAPIRKKKGVRRIWEEAQIKNLYST